MFCVKSEKRIKHLRYKLIFVQQNHQYVRQTDIFMDPIFEQGSTIKIAIYKKNKVEK